MPGRRPSTGYEPKPHRRCSRSCPCDVKTTAATTLDSRRPRGRRSRGREGPYRPRQRVVSQALTDTGAVDQWGDADPAEVILRTDTGQLQELWRAESACAQDDLLVGESLVRTSTTVVFDTDGAAIANNQAVDQRLGHDHQILLVSEVAARGALALALVD